MTFGKAAVSALPRSALLMAGILLVAWGAWTNIIIPNTAMSPDESWTYDSFESVHSPFEMVQLLTTGDIHPPMWWIIGWSWYELVGGSEFALRWQPVFFGLLTLAYVFRIGKTWFRDARYGLFAALLLMVSAPFVWFSTEIRPYAWLFFLTCAAMDSFRRWMVQPTWRNAAIYAAMCAMLMYSHYYLAFLILAQAGYFLLSRPSRRMLVQGIGIAIGAFLIWLPWLPVFIHQMTLLLTITPSQKGGIGFIPANSATNLKTIVDVLTTTANGFPWLPLVLMSMGAILLRHKPPYRLLLTWALVPITLVLLVNLRVEVFTLRYVSFGLAGMMVASGMALAALPRRTGWPVIGVIVALMAVNLPNYIVVHAPFREVLTTIAAEATPEDVIYLDFMNNTDRHLRRQLQLYLPAEFHRQLVTEFPENSSAKRIWHVTDGLYEPDKLAHFEQLNDGSRVVKLSTGGCSAKYCLVAQLLERPPLDEPIIFGENIPFYGYEIQSISAAQLDVILWWQFDTPVTFEYSIGVYLLDAAGNTISQTDGPIKNYYGGAELPMTAAEMNHPYLDVRMLALPPGLSPDTPYTLALAVYDWRDGQRLPVNGSDLLTIGTIRLPDGP